MLLLLMLPVFLLPLVGIGVDATRMYIVQSKLSAALDGAALGSGRMLGTNANTTELAGEFLKANYPAGFWGTSNFQSNVGYTSNQGVSTITVSASVSLPLTFLRLLGISNAPIGDTAVATRRATRVVMVLDRSGSMNNTDPVSGQNVFTIMQNGAEWFAAQFVPNYDELGVVVFSGAGIVAYPEYTLPYKADPTATGGPDKSFATNTATQTGPVFDMLKAMAVGGGTGTPEALAMAYIELQKAHNRDLAANGVDNSLNTIVLFTDGVPDAISAYPNNPGGNNNSLKAAGSTQCKNNPASASDKTTQMTGYMVSPGSPVSPSNPYPGWGTTWAFLDLFAYDANQSLTNWVGSKGATTFPTGCSAASCGKPSSAYTSCVYLGSNGTDCSQNGNNCTANDLKQIPPVDYYGYSTTGNAYLNSYMTNGTSYWSPNVTAYDPNTPTTGYNVAAASWNETDGIGSVIRSQTAMNQIQIFTIGYSGNGGTDIGLLKRLANVSSSSSFNQNQSIGQFYQADNTDELTQAFAQVASSLLRLAR
jgi:hypothetical protein